MVRGAQSAWAGALQLPFAPMHHGCRGMVALHYPLTSPLLDLPQGALCSRRGCMCAALQLRARTARHVMQGVKGGACMRG